MKTIAQQMNVTEFPFRIKDEKGNEIYFETSNGFWVKREYDSNGNRIYGEDSDGNWYKQEYDSRGNIIYFEDSNSIIIDNRPKPVVEFTLEYIAKLAGVSVEQIKIKK